MQRRIATTTARPAGWFFLRERGRRSPSASPSTPRPPRGSGAGWRLSCAAKRRGTGICSPELSPNTLFCRARPGKDGFSSARAPICHTCHPHRLLRWVPGAVAQQPPGVTHVRFAADLFPPGSWGGFPLVSCSIANRETRSAYKNRVLLWFFFNRNIPI